jgi:hypothetical protein
MSQTSRITVERTNRSSGCYGAMTREEFSRTVTEISYDDPVSSSSDYEAETVLQTHCFSNTKDGIFEAELKTGEVFSFLMQ